MASKVVLVSEDSDFFEFIKPKLELRKSDDLLQLAFDEIPENVHLLDTSMLIVNSEDNKEKTLDLLFLFKQNPVIVFSFNEDAVFKRKCYRAGAFDFKTLLTPDADIRASLLPALNQLTLLEKNRQYRALLEKENFIKKEQEVFLDYESILDKELENIILTQKKAVFMAIAPNERNKFFLKQELLELVLTNNVRKNDIIMNFAPNKYYLLLFDIDKKSAEKLWTKIREQIPEKIYAGIVEIFNQGRQKLINEALNKLHTEINSDITSFVVKERCFGDLPVNNQINFKMFKQEYFRKIKNIVTPVFYQVYQKYLDKMVNVKLEQIISADTAKFIVLGRAYSAAFIISAPGFLNINIDISLRKNENIIDSKRISISPNELDEGFLEDLLEHFILDYKKGAGYDS